jgi:hypothetical protein
MWLLDALTEFLFGRYRSWTRLVLAVLAAILIGWLLRELLG